MQIQRRRQTKTTVQTKHRETIDPGPRRENPICAREGATKPGISGKKKKRKKKKKKKKKKTNLNAMAVTRRMKRPARGGAG